MTPYIVRGLWIQRSGVRCGGVIGPNAPILLGIKICALCFLNLTIKHFLNLEVKIHLMKVYSLKYSWFLLWLFVIQRVAQSKINLNPVLFFFVPKTISIRKQWNIFFNRSKKLSKANLATSKMFCTPSTFTLSAKGTFASPKALNNAEKWIIVSMLCSTTIWSIADWLRISR